MEEFVERSMEYLYTYGIGFALGTTVILVSSFMDVVISRSSYLHLTKHHYQLYASGIDSVNTNLLIMDEIFDSSLDGMGTEEFLKIIKYVIKDANVFVISHKQALHDRFESMIQFEKVKGFSRMVQGYKEQNENF